MQMSYGSLGTLVIGENKLSRGLSAAGLTFAITRLDSYISNNHNGILYVQAPHSGSISKQTA